MTADSALLPIGSQDFEALRDCGQLYVDKTDFVYALARQRRQFFLSRSRRFGKSLLLSTFASLFSHGTDFFRGLSIASQWKDKRYKVLLLDFSVLKAAQTSTEFLQGLRAELARACRAAGLLWVEQENNPIQDFGDFLSRQPANSLVLLIDEYDAPLAVNLTKPDLYAQIQRYFETFYGFIKAHNRCLRFFFITGILRFQHTSIFSAFNSLKDISLDPAYGEMLGYTEEELKRYFRDFLDRAQQTQGLTRAELLRAVQQHYDGFCFDQCASKHVYAPWSVLEFLDNPRLGMQNYWYRSGGSLTILMRFCQKKDLVALADLQQLHAVPLSLLMGMSDIDRMDPYVLLYQTGYLSIRSVSHTDVLLGYPNIEVRNSLAQFFAERIWPQAGGLRNLSSSMRTALETGNSEKLCEVLNHLVCQIDYQDFPLDKESAVKALLQVFLLGTGLQPQIEVHSYRGRSDLECDSSHWHWVIECKFVHRDKDIAAAIERGKAQMLERDYGAAYRKKRKQEVLVFCAQSRRCVLQALS